GTASEVWLSAQDPETVIPAPGHMSNCELPEGKVIRNEAAVTGDYDVTPYYDPMIGKLIVKGSDRSEAIARLKEALFTYEIEGIKTNIPMLKTVADHEEFKNGNTTTAFVETYYLPMTKTN